MLGRHFALIDAYGKVLARVAIPDGVRGMALLSFESQVRAEFGVDDEVLFCRDSGLDEMP